MVVWCKTFGWKLCCFLSIWLTSTLSSSASTLYPVMIGSVALLERKRKLNNHVSIKIILKRILRKQFFSICMWVYQSFLPFILHFIRSTMNILIYAVVNLTIVNWKFSKNQKENLGSFRPDVSSLQQINKLWIILYIDSQSHDGFSLLWSSLQNYLNNIRNSLTSKLKWTCQWSRNCWS